MHKEENTAVKLEHVSKSFPGVNALTDVSFSVTTGTVHVVCGENGAGKSTIMKIINGMYKPDRGKVTLDGCETIHSAAHACKVGVATIFQELSYIPEITVAEFITLGAWPMRYAGLAINWNAVYKNARELLAQEELSYNLKTKLKDLSISDIQMLEIAKVVHSGAHIIIMDEPTSSITQKEADALLQKIDKLKMAGKSIIYISHKMDEIFRIADDITVLRDGFVVRSGSKSEFSMSSIIAQMVGRELAEDYPKETVSLGDEILVVKDFARNGFFHDVSFAVRRGEIVGFAGIIGSGRTSTMRSLCGLDTHDSGRIEIENKPVHIKNVKTSMAQGMVMVSEDRRRYGLVSMRSVKENLTMTNMRRYIYRGYVHTDAERTDVIESCTNMNIKTPSINTATDALSGGNQQKIVLAKWLLNEPNIFVLDEPTRGIDVGAKYEIYKLMQNFAAQGKALIMVSSELPELLGMCDRIYVMRSGTIAGMMSRANFDAQEIMRLATVKD